MRIDPRARVMTLLLACMTAIGPVTMDLYLASMPHISQALGAPTAKVQLTLSFYLIGFAIGQIVYGPLSDAVGRRPMLMTGFAIYLVSTAACAFAWSIDMLIAARMFQALGSSGPIIIARAIVRDLHSGSRAARQLGLMTAIMGVTPIGAPIIGGFLQAWFGWRASFIAMGSISSILAALAFLFMPETNSRIGKTHFSPAAILSSFRIVAKNKAYRSYLSMLAIAYCGIFAFLSGSSYVLQRVFHLDSVQFGFTFALCSMSYVAGTALGTRLVTKLRLEGMLKLGASVMLAGGILQVIGYALLPQSYVPMLVPQMLYFLGTAFMVPQTIAAALTPFPERAGAASSLMGFTQMGSAAIIGGIMGAMLSRSAWPLITVMAAAAVTVFLILHISEPARIRARKPAEAYDSLVEDI